MVTSTVSNLNIFSLKIQLILFSYTQKCSVCDGNQQRTTRFRNCSNCSNAKHNLHHHHFNHTSCYRHHRRNRGVIKQGVKRCTFAATATEIPNQNELISEENQHMSFKSQSSNSSNASSSIRIME